MILIKEDLCEAVSETPPTQITTEWQKKDKNDRVLINVSMEDALIVHVKISPQQWKLGKL